MNKIKSSTTSGRGTRQPATVMTIYRTGADGVKREVTKIGSVERREPVGVFQYK